MTEASAVAFTTCVTTSGRFSRTATEIAIIDTALSGWRDLLAGLPAGVEAVLIGEGRDGVAAMAQALAGLHGIRALHVLCHGFEGGLQLGTARLDEASLTAREAELTAIGACLAQDGDILLYGCNVASGHGESFLDALADITGAAMAASRTLTGAAELGGDWDLAWMRGTVRTEALRIEQYRGVLAAPFFDLAVAYTGENTITLKYEDTLDSTSNPLLTHFVATDGTVNAGTGSILINGTAVALISAVVSDNLVTLTVGQQFQLNDAIAFRYEDPAGDDLTGVIQAPYGLDTFSVDVSVTVLSARPPAFLSSSAQSGGNKVVLSFDQALDENNPPSIQQFFGSSTTSGQIRINGVYYTVSGVDVIGSNVIVEVGNGYIFQSGDAVSLRYYDGDTVDSTTAIQNQGGVDIPDFRTSFTVQLHAPTLTAAGGTPTYSGSQTQPLFSSATASTNDSGQIFTAMTVTVTGMLDGVNEALYFTVPGMMGSLELYLVDGASHFIDPVQMSGTRVTGTVSVSNGTATIRITGMALSDAEMASLINDITYYNAAGTPSDGQRIIAVTGLTDDGGSVDTGDITGVSATINVGTPASSLPTLTATSTAPTYIQNAAPVDLFSGVAADTNDIGQVFTGLILTVTNVVDVEWLSLDGIIPISLSSNAAGTPVTAPGLTGAVLTTSYSGTTATVTLSGFSLTGTQLAALIDGIAYVNAGDAVNGIVTPGNRVVTITSVTDDGASNNTAPLTGVSATVSVAGAPTTSVAPTVTLTTEDTYGQSVALGTVTADLFDGVTASTVDGGQTFTGMVLTVHGVLFGANERLTVGGSSITLTAGTGVFSKGNYAVTVVNGVATVTLSGMSLTDGEMNALIDDLGYACDNAGLGMAPSDQFALTDTRSIVLRSITDSGASNNTTMVNKVATVSLGQKDSQSPMITVTPNNPTVTFAPGTTTAVSFTVTVATAATVGDGALFFNVKAPDGLTISNVKMNGGMPVFAFGASPGTYTLTFNVTTTGTTTSGAFPISITAGYSDSISPIPTIAVKSGSTMVTIAEPAPVLQSAAVDGTALVLTYDMALDGTNIPAANAFAVQIGGNTVSVTNVAVDGANKTVTLTLGQAVAHTDTVTVAYTDPTAGDDTNAVQSTTGADAATFAAQAVTNNTLDPNGTPPTLTLTPVDGYGQLIMGNPVFDLFDAVTASTVDSGQTFTGMVLTVHHVAGTGSDEFLTIAGTDITLSNGTSGSFTGGNYAVTLVNGVATVTLSGMALSNSAMSTLIDGIAYKTTAFTVSSLDQFNIGFSETRPIVLRSITDSGAANNTTEVNKLVTASFGMQPGSLSPITITPDNPTATFASGTPTQLSFTVNIGTALTLVGSTLHFDVAAPSGWTIANLQLDGFANNTLAGIIPIGVHTLTFDVTASGTDTSGHFPISIFTSTSGLIPQASVSSGSVLVALAPPAPVLQSAAVDGTSLVLTYDVALDAANGPAAGAFVVKAGGNTVTVTGVAVDSAAKTVTLTLGQAVQQGQTVTVSYTDPTSGNDVAAIQNATGGADAATVTDQSVTNNTPDTTPPSITNVTIPNQPAKVGDTVTVTITVASDSDTYTLGNGSTVGGFALGNLTKVSATTYTATFTVTADGLRTGDRAAADDIPVNIVLVDSASNANTPYTTAISQTNDRIDTNAPPTLVVPTTPPTLVDTAADDSFPMVDGQLSASDLEGDTLTYSIAGSQASPLQYGSVTLSNGVTYDTWSTGPGGTSYVNSQTGHYAYVFDAAFLNGVPAGPMQGTSTFTVSDGNRTVSQQLTLNFTGANDSPI
ncbi:SwmB domain-containing protein, partial [Azospirillum brasilense]